MVNQIKTIDFNLLPSQWVLIFFSYNLQFQLITISFVLTIISI